MFTIYSLHVHSFLELGKYTSITSTTRTKRTVGDPRKVCH